MIRSTLLAVALATAGPAVASEQCVASYYTEGTRTASGERYNRWAHTCAHKRHPFGTILRVSRRDTGASATCRVNDRGPFIWGRCVDVSAAGARSLGLDRSGIAPVVVEVVAQR